MFPSTVPRVFVLAGLVLLFLVFGTSFYLYDDEPYYPPKTPPQPGNIADFLPESGPQKSTSSSNEVVLKDGDEVHAYKPNGAGEVVNIDVDVITPPLDEHLADAIATSAPVQPSPETDDSENNTSDTTDDPRPPPPPGQCIEELGFLRRSLAQLQLSPKVHYSRRCIQPVFSDSVDRDEVVDIFESLIGRQSLVDIANCQDVRLPRCVPIKLTVPRPYPKQKYANFIFGVATDFDRLAESIVSFAHWLANTDAKLIAVVTDIANHNPVEIQELERQFRTFGMDVTLVKPLHDKHTTSQSHFTVLTYMLDHSSPDTHWYALLDDDTFFPNLKPLSDALATINHNKDAYVGTLSEDFGAIRTFGYMAFGGAGVYLSAPLARKLGANAFQCANQANEGDIIVRDCVYQYSRAKLTILPGLYQQDMKGDASGFFESGVRALNFHHWKSWFTSPIVEMAAAAIYCGDCFLQRWRFGKDEIFSNGYSIVKYRDGFQHVDLTTMEATWNHGPLIDYDFSIGPLRLRMGPELKKSYRLLDVDVTENGEFKQLYVWKGNAQVGEFDEVVEVVWGK